MMEKQWQANGKLLLSGEYLVLDGAKVLAVPTRFGQRLTVRNTDSGAISWKSYDADGTLWFEGSFSFKDIREGHYRHDDKTWCTLMKILHEGHSFAPKSFGEGGFEVETRLTFPRFWGLGTSSTLIYLIGQWLGVDAFALSDRTLGGSGYDISCAGANGPIFYSRIDGKPEAVPADFNPPFAEQLYFVYLNKKQDSRAAIANYYDKRSRLKDEITLVSAISSAMAMTREFSNFTALMEEHERLVGAILDVPVLKERLFHDFEGSVKSLGAWGGDFILAASRTDPTAYFKQKGYDVVLPYREMIP